MIAPRGWEALTGIRRGDPGHAFRRTVPDGNADSGPSQAGVRCLSR